MSRVLSSSLGKMWLTTKWVRARNVAVSARYPSIRLVARSAAISGNITKMWVSACSRVQSVRGSRRLPASITTWSNRGRSSARMRSSSSIPTRASASGIDGAARTDIPELWTVR